MPIKLSTILKKLESMTEPNQVLLQEFYEFLKTENSGERHIISLLNLLISLDKYLQFVNFSKAGRDPDITFTSINSKEQILEFLNHRQQKDGIWVERVKDVDGKHITTFNYYLSLLIIFFRWLYNRNNKSEEDWETPHFLEIRNKKPLRESPYGINDIWVLDDLLTIVEYEPELRNKAIITLLWDLDARPHEITALRIKDIILNGQYGEGSIPSNTKTGGGAILLTSSFTYVRDWINTSITTGFEVL